MALASSTLLRCRNNGRRLQNLAKCSVLALVLRIIGTKSGKIKIFCIGLMAVSAAWGVGSCLAFLINCRADTLLTLDNVKQCPNQNIRWAVITAVDISTEILTWLLIVQLSWTVNMSFTRKCQVAMVFSFRLLLIALSISHLVYFDKYPTSPQPQFAIASSLLFQQVMIVWSLISATVPNMKNFLKSFSIGMGFPLPPDLSWNQSGQSYPLQSLENRQPRSTSSTAATGAGTLTSGGFYDPGDSGLRNRPYNWRLGQVSNETTAKAHGDILRDARYSELPRIAHVLAQAFWEDNLFGQLIHPHRNEYPDDVDLYWLRRARVNFWDYRRRWLVATDKDKSGQEVIVGIAQWERLGDGGKKLDCGYLDPRNISKPLSSVAMKIHALVWPNRASDPIEEDIIERSYPHFDKVWSGKRAESWYLEALAVHPDYQGKHIGRKLVQWGLEQAEAEGVCASVVSAFGKDQFYMNCGFDEQYGSGRQGDGNPLADIDGANIFWKWPKSSS
ncbi:acyl-CoA N-acyltransferase [Trichoderma evansii]